MEEEFLKELLKIKKSNEVFAAQIHSMIKSRKVKRTEPTIHKHKGTIEASDYISDLGLLIVDSDSADIDNDIPDGAYGAYGSENYFVSIYGDASLMFWCRPLSSLFCQVDESDEDYKAWKTEGANELYVTHNCDAKESLLKASYMLTRIADDVADDVESVDRFLGRDRLNDILMIITSINYYIKKSILDRKV